MSHPDPLRALLSDSGYVTKVRRCDEEWISTLRRDGERWVGAGASENDALDDALAQALPSSLGWQLLRWAVPQTASSSADYAAAVFALDDVEVAGAQEVAELPAASRVAPVEVDLAVVETPQTSEKGSATLGINDEGADLHPVDMIVCDGVGKDTRNDVRGNGSIDVDGRGDEVDAPSANAISVHGAATTAEQQVETKLVTRPAAHKQAPWFGAPEDRETAARYLDNLSRQIRVDLDDLATEPPDVQRLQITAWMAWARAISSCFPDYPPVHEGAMKITKFLGQVGKHWWPGVVRIMHSSMAPCDVAKDLGLEAAETTALGWHDIAEHVELILAAEVDPPSEYRVLRWADASRRQPKSQSPNALLKRATAMIQAVVGDVKGPAPDWATVESTMQLESMDWRRLEEAAATLRWICDDVARPKAWAQLMGRLRWLTRHLSKPTPKLVQYVNPMFRPATDWASTLGVDPTKRSAQRAIRGLQVEREAFGAKPSQEVLTDWLVRAFEIPSKWLSAPQLASMVATYADQVSALPPKSVGSRGKRRRLRSLVKQLAKMGDGSTEPLPNPLVSVDCEDVDTDDVHADEERAGPTQTDDQKALVAALVPVTQGKRALVVSNREDASVRRELGRLLQMEMESCVATPRRTQSACEAIARGGYDFVVCATGFIGHSTENRLRAAVGGSSTVLVRAYKARVLGCLRALARDLGVA